jgi:hypothetical protein
MIEVDLPDGGIAEFPDGTPNEIIKGALQKRFGAPQQAPSMLDKALEPITSYPETYNQMNRESRDEMSRGAGQIATAMSGEDQMGYPVNRLTEGAKGVGNMALGALGYATSPINAALRTVAGKPIEENTGIPKEISETALSFVLPVPKAMPRMANIGRTEAAAVPTTEGLFKSATSRYKTADADTTMFAPQQLNTLADDIGSTLKANRSRDYLAPQAWKAVDELRLDGAGRIDDIRTTRELLGEIGQSADKNERKAAKIAVQEIDKFLAKSVPETAKIFKTADADFAAASRAKKLDEAADVAGLRTGRAGYGGNAVNTMRQVLSPIVEKAMKGKKQGYSNDEIQALRGIVEGDEITNTLRLAGQFSPEKGVFQSAFGTGVGVATTGGVGFAIPAIGAASNRLASFLTGQQIERLNEMVRKRSPAYAEAVAKASQKYFEAGDQFVADPTPQKFVRALVASRSLASGLSRDGVSVSSGDLLRLLQGGAPARADNENPEAVGIVNP